MVYYAGDELLYLVSQARLIPFVEELLVIVQVLIAELEIVGLPPWTWHVGVSLGARDDEVALCLNAKTYLKGTDCFGISEYSGGIDVYSVLESRVQC